MDFKKQRRPKQKSGETIFPPGAPDAATLQGFMVFMKPLKT
jgi:hypothetical protein